jgi:hypothetical protein
MSQKAGGNSLLSKDPTGGRNCCSVTLPKPSTLEPSICCACLTVFSVIGIHTIQTCQLTSKVSVCLGTNPSPAECKSWLMRQRVGLTSEASSDARRIIMEDNYEPPSSAHFDLSFFYDWNLGFGDALLGLVAFQIPQKLIEK